MEKKENNEELLAFLKRKGFVYQGSEIYGGLAGIWEFGHLGKLMKNNLENVWKNYFLSFRNEISPKHSLIRCREFEQAELQIFFNPREINNEQITDTNTFSEIKNEKLKIILKDERNKPEKEISASKLLDYGLPKYYVYHMVKVQEYILQILKIPKEKFRFYELNDQEKAFYNKNHFDMEYYSESLNDWVEIGGVHYRTDHDLGGHQKISQVNLSVLDEKTNEKYIPHVLELSFGHWRNFYFLIEEHLKFDKKRENNILMLPPKIAPLKAAIFPMIKQPEYEDYARGIFNELEIEIAQNK